MTRTFFRATLMQALTAAGATPPGTAIDMAAEQLAAHYGEPVRAYHNDRHIRDLCNGLAECDECTRLKPALQLAILYHDVIYNPRRADNETASAAFAVSALSALGVARPIVSRTADLIRATQHGVAALDPSDSECALLLDLDLAILGAPVDAYRTYTAAIRQEYAHVPEPQFRAGRSRVLQIFLAMPAIYRTPRCSARYEAQARVNLDAEHAALIEPA